MLVHFDNVVLLAVNYISSQKVGPKTGFTWDTFFPALFASYFLNTSVIF